MAYGETVLVHLWLVRCYASTGKLDAAVSIAHRLLSVKEDVPPYLHARILGELGNAYRVAKMVQPAASYLDSAIALYGDAGELLSSHSVWCCQGRTVLCMQTRKFGRGTSIWNQLYREYKAAAKADQRLQSQIFWTAFLLMHVQVYSPGNPRREELKPYLILAVEVVSNAKLEGSVLIRYLKFALNTSVGLSEPGLTDKYSEARLRTWEQQEQYRQLSAVHDSEVQMLAASVPLSGETASIEG